MRILISGITGFCGSHLAEFCIGKGCVVFGPFRQRSRMENIEHIRDEIWLRECDMTDPNATESLVKWAKPNIVFHLAAQSFVGGSWDNAASTIRTNIYCQLNLLEAIRKLKMDVVVIIAGSGVTIPYSLLDPAMITTTSIFNFLIASRRFNWQ